MPHLDHVNVVVGDPDRSVAFYTHLLSLTVVMDRMLEGVWFEDVTGIAGARARCIILDAPGGGCRVELLAYLDHDGTPLPVNSRPATPGLRHFAVRVDNIEACLSGLDDPPLIIAVPHHIVPSGKRMAYVHDPDGTIVELAEYAATPNFG